MAAMKTFMLRRHADAGWTEPGLGDHARTLSSQGRLEARAMARWLAARKPWPDRVLCSSAARARETAALMREAMSASPEAEVSDGLYHAGPGMIMDHLRRLPGESELALLIGHEPGLGSLLRILVGEDGPGAGRAGTSFPTAAIAVLEATDGDWRNISADLVTFSAFRAPRELNWYHAPGA
jgi:phosphohistidine phosphatase